MNQIVKPELKEGEVYAGAIINPDGSGNHIILLPGDHNDTNWRSAMDWAKEQGGDLPNRVETALLFNQSKDQFKENWYWTNETNKSSTEWAWSQGFSYGSQGYGSENYKLRARAVRRLAI